MWYKVLLFAVFLCLLFILSRLRDAIAYYEGGYLASRLLDPVALSARKLKLLLDQRGVSYAGVVEKKELTDLVQTTGEVSEGELESAEQEEETSSFTEFKGGSHFYEEVEDCKDSVWVVQVVHSPHIFMSPPEWTTLVQKVSRFGVRTGYFNCAQDPRLCEKKGWYSARLVLALPQGDKAKDNVILKSYVGSSRTQAVLDWVNYNLASRIKEIRSTDELRRDWLSFSGGAHHHKLRLILVSSLNIPPMFYSVMSIKWTGRAMFGTINIDTAMGRDILNSTRWEKTPAYMVVMPEQVYMFGLSPGEYPNIHSIALFLKTLQPEVNDVFLLSLVIVNVMCWFELVLGRGGILKRLGGLLWHICKWNCLLILLCFPVLGIFQLTYAQMLVEGVVKLLRLMGTSWLASLVRADWLMYYSNNMPFLCVIFTGYALGIGVLHYKYGWETDDGDADQTGRSPIAWDTYANFLFRPISGAVPFMPSTRELEMDIGMEMLIEQLSLPNIWLGPLMSTDYLNDLPIWKYTGPNIDSDVGSDTDCMTPRCDSEHEDGPSSRPDSPRPDVPCDNQPTMFICEKCRALQESVDMTEEGLEKRHQEQLASESACAKYLMDGNYKCMCRHTNDQHGTNSHAPSPKHSPKLSPSRLRKAESKTRLESDSRQASGDSDVESYHPPPGMLPTLDCSICLEGLKYGVILCGLPCKHSFHHECIMRWLKQYNHLCPLCRWPAYKAKPCSLHQHAD